MCLVNNRLRDVRFTETRVASSSVSSFGSGNPVGGTSVEPGGVLLCTSNPVSYVVLGTATGTAVAESTFVVSEGSVGRRTVPVAVVGGAVHASTEVGAEWS